MLVGGVYRPELFGLRYTDDPEQSDGSFWSSKIRPAAVSLDGTTYQSVSNGGVRTTEYLEIDYGRTRQIMGLMLDVIRLPFDITIEYDALSSDDGSHTWVEVSQDSDLRFDDTILYDASATSSFEHCEFYFTTPKGEMVHTRFLRIGFTRRDVGWPTGASLGIPYPAIVRNLRTFRTVSDRRHMVGPLFSSEIGSNTEMLQLNEKVDLETYEVTQRFVFPTDAVRGEGTSTTSDDIVPALLGFSFLAEVKTNTLGADESVSYQGDAKWRWSLWDVTSGVELDRGLISGAVNSGKCWVDGYFHNPIDGSTNTTYELRVKSLNTVASSAIYTNSPVDVPGFLVPSSLTAERRSRLFTVEDAVAGMGLASIDDYIQAVDGLNSYKIVSLGQPGGYASFDGVSGRIDIAHDAALNTADWSASFWYRRPAGSMGSVESVMVDNSDVSSNGWRIGLTPDGYITTTAAGTTLTDVTSSVDGEWHHVLVAYDDAGGTLSLYKDGVLVAADAGLTYSTNTSEPMCIGTKWGTDWDNLVYGSDPWTSEDVRYQGDIDDLIVFNAELAAGDAISIYENGHGGVAGNIAIESAYGSSGTNELVAYLFFNDDIGSTTATDSYGTYDGTVQSAGVSFTGDRSDEYIVEVDRGWREQSGSRQFFVVPRFTHVSGDQYNADYRRNLAIRIWADVGDSGRDVLGNQYRYATRMLDSASRVLDPASPGWMSAPRPSPEAVESLYFDVRQPTDNGEPDWAVIDNIRIAPRTHGVRMHVYYTRDNLTGDAPTQTDHWDHMVWTPVNEVYTLRRDEAIQLPHGVQASFIKLEFTNLRPAPFEIPAFPELPPVEFKRHPTWVENAFENTKLRTAVEDWFLQKQTPVQRRILREIANPIQEFLYKSREFLTALSQGALDDPRLIGSEIIDAGTGTFIDPVTSSKIRLTTPDMYRGSLTATIRDESLLGRAVRSRPQNLEPLTREEMPVREQMSAFVSTRGDRVSYSFSGIAETPMWFNRTCRHYYRVDRARFNRKAYYVGIREIEFRRNDYTVEYDDSIIDDDLHDDSMLEVNSFTRNPMTKISDGQTVYVSYSLGTDVYTDEAVTLSGDTYVDLSGVGEVASNVRVYSAPNGQGVQYDPTFDFVITQAYQIDGDLITQIGRSTMTEYIEVDDAALTGIVFRDSGVVAAYASAIDEGA